MATLHVPGRRLAASTVAQARPGRFMDLRVRDAVDVARARAGAPEVVLEGLADDDVLEIELEDGVAVWTRVDDLRADLQRSPSRGPDDSRADGDDLFLGPRLALGEAARGPGRWAIRALRLLGLDVPTVGARALVRRIEDGLEPGLHLCPDPCALEPLGGADLAGDAPVLLFLHGTASSTRGSFGGLTDDGVSSTWETLRRRYGRRVAAFEHATLSASPLQNAVDLLEALPERTRLHVVSHSRGGLLAEILARGQAVGRDAPFDARDREAFEATGRHAADLERLDVLNELLTGKRIRVERLVRVAAPVAGTTLAAGRLDRYLGTIVNLLRRIPAVGQSVAFELASALLLAVVKKRADPDELPGLEAMMPSSPLVWALSAPGLRLESELAVVAGDVQRSGLWHTLKVLATNLYYREDHDFVVQTRSMYRGAERTTPGHYFFDRGPDVEHFHYFRNATTRAALLDGLAGHTGGASGYRPLAGVDAPREVRAIVRRDGLPRPAVVLLPGIMGSHLRAGGDWVWVHLARLAVGEIRRLAIDADDVEPRALVGSAYADLAEYLGRTHDVLPFPYDWRRPIGDAADRLAGTLRERLDASPLPVSLLAHSMGGLVARALIQAHADVWARLTARGGRLVMLGTPNGGSYMIRDVLLGRAPTLRKLARLDLRHRVRHLVRLVAEFPGMLALLPTDSRQGDPFTRAFWEELGALAGGDAHVPDAAALAAARAFHDGLGPESLDPAHVLYVAGQDALTPVEHDVVEEGGRRRVRFLATTAGDGRVPWASGIPERLDAAGRVWYMDAPHGRMAAHLPAFPALRELVDTGATRRLPQAPPAVRGGARTFEMPDYEPETLPDAAELEASALGFDPGLALEPTPGPRIQVSIVHGDLAHARFPVAVGHHDGDGLVSAEAVLDRYVGGQLGALHRLGLYPGPVGTAEVVLDGSAFPPGAVVLGLGPFGSLTTGRLARSTTQAVLELAVRHEKLQAQEARRAADAGEAPPERTPPRMSSLLVGSGYGGLGMREAIRGVLEGVMEANRRLAADARGTAQPIDRVEFVELYEDRALAGFHILRTLLRQQAFDVCTLETPQVRRVPGGRRSVVDRSETNWWQRLRVRGCDDDGRPMPYLSFTALTDRARAEIENLPVQRRLVDAMLRDAAREAEWDRELAQTMFELLVPNEFKPYAADQRNILWVVDEVSAAYPWELLHDPSLGDREPAAVRGGMLRQLATPMSRTQPEPALQRDALVVGDPASRLPALPGAQAEARVVAQALGGAGYTPHHLDRPDGGAVLRALFARPYTLLHLAGHGVYEQQTDDGVRTGMVIGDDVFLTPAIVEQMRRVPDLVFVNCCHLGRIELPGVPEAARRERYRLAANLGTQFIQMGVRAVVVAGWAVDDGAALTFADALYRALLDGQPFGEAVRVARAAAHGAHPGTNTWGAYQCYGDPYFQLREHEGARERAADVWADPAEVVTHLYNLTRQAESSASRDPGLCATLDAAVRALPTGWGDRADVLEGLLRANASLDRLAEAVDCYARLDADDAATYSIEALEHGALLQVRHGVALACAAAAGDAVREQGQAMVREGMARLEHLVALGRTPRRLALLGSARKHAARLASPAERAERVDAARACYRDAAEAGGGAYPLFNQLMLDAVLDWLQPRSPEARRTAEHEERLARVAEARAAAADDDAARPAFWHLSIDAHAALYTLLYHGPADAERTAALRRDVVEGLARAWRRSGTFLVRRSIEDQLEVLAHLVAPPDDADSPKERERRALAALLLDLRAELLQRME